MARGHSEAAGKPPGCQEWPPYERRDRKEFVQVFGSAKKSPEPKSGARGNSESSSF